MNGREGKKDTRKEREVGEGRKGGQGQKGEERRKHVNIGKKGRKESVRPTAWSDLDF